MEPRAEGILLGRAVLNKVSEELMRTEEGWITEPKELKVGLLVARTIVADRFEDVPVRVMNLNENPIRVRAGTVISELNAVELLSGPESTKGQTNAEQCKVIEELVNKVDETVEE